jgi:hypothetical protein
LKAIESALGALVPLSSRLDRDKLMFQAGAMSRPWARQRGWVWPALAAAMTVALAGESLWLGVRPAPRAVERIVFVPASTTDLAATAPSAVSGATASHDQKNSSRAPAAGEPRSVESWAVASDYQRLQELVLRFGLDALPVPASVASRLDGGVQPIGPGPKPAGVLRSLELERIFKPGGPS